MELVFLFRSPYNDYSKYNGQECRIVHVYEEEDDNHDPESLPMFAVILEDGTQFEAYPEELVPYREDK